MRHDLHKTAAKIRQRLTLLEPLVYRRRTPLDSFVYKVLPDAHPTPLIGRDVDTANWLTVKPGTDASAYWIKKDTNFVLRGAFSIPANWPADQPIGLYLPIGDAQNFSHPEALVYIDGALTASCDRHHHEVLLADSYRDGKAHVLALHGYSGYDDPRKPSLPLRIEVCQVVQIDQKLRDFIAFVRVTLSILDLLPDDQPTKWRLLDGLDAAFKCLDLREPFEEAFYNSVPDAYEVLREVVDSAGAPLDAELTAVGHAHIDVAWLWTVNQSRGKAARTFTNALRLMEQFPDFYFTQSQPQLYDFVRRDMPEVFAQIKQRVAEGRWEAIGGMWVEADCNISGPESLARQFLLGRRFFRQHFGSKAESPVLWLPDVFGYSWALPQLIKEAGLDYFFTIKISWNQTNHMPYDTFWWQGLDGTRVLTHFSTTPDPNMPPFATYNAAATPSQVMGTWRNFQQKDQSRHVLMAYGYGDGGGGPTREMVENLRELKQFPAAPQVKTGKVIDFFRAVEQEATAAETNGTSLPVWNGELYLELHRGTYTTQARNKYANRKSEFLLHDAEFLATVADQYEPGYYPADDLRRAWELVCLNQFHDILPGSSITQVYKDSQAQYAEVAQIAEAVTNGALAIIADYGGGDVLIVNPSPVPRSDLVFWEEQLSGDKQLRRPDGRSIPAQRTPEGTWISPGRIEPYSVLPLQVVSGMDTMRRGVVAAPGRLENDFLRIEYDKAGDIVLIYDKTHERHVLTPGKIANQLQAFEDRPVVWDAWDIDSFYEDKMWTSEPAESVKVSHGQLRATIEVKRRILNSPYTQRISMDYNSPRLLIETEIDWREKHMLLKAAFPVEILATVATHEIQWGSVQRPTHHNTSWDWARFETVAQKWVDLSEGNYGVSLLNDSKYGHDVRDNVLRISLLRASTWPDPEADQGIHTFSYALLPHAGDWRISTIPAAYALNDPLILIPGRGGSPRTPQSFVTADHQNIVIETVKRAEDGEGIIVRLYESHCIRGTCTLTTGFDLAGAEITNILEDPGTPVMVDGRKVALRYQPFQIITLRLIPA